MRKAARELLKLEEKHPKRLFEGAALLRRLHRLGVLDESKNKLDFVLGLKHEDFLERRLQTLVFKLHLAKSIHHARVLVRQGHIRYVFPFDYYLLNYITFAAFVCSFGFISITPPTRDDKYTNIINQCWKASC